MGFKKFFKAIINDEAFGDTLIEQVEDRYIEAQKDTPNQEPHHWLAMSWLLREKHLRGLDLMDPSSHHTALKETFLHACVQTPKCARSLGLKLLKDEHSEVYRKYPKYEQESFSLMAPVTQAEKDSTQWSLYKKYNPKKAKQEDEVGFIGLTPYHDITNS
jgi:hypothetical protein